MTSTKEYKVTKCDECGVESYVIYITKDYKKLCPECEDKRRNKERPPTQPVPA